MSLISYIKGTVVTSDGERAIVLTASGLGYEFRTPRMLTPGREIEIFLAHIIKEASQELFGFFHLEEKNMFKLLLSVKGVGPRSAYSLVNSIGVKGLVDAILFDKQSILKKAPGIGAKAAAQIILDLSSKVKTLSSESMSADSTYSPQDQESSGDLLEETLMACKELGFKEDKIFPIIKNILKNKKLNTSEELLNLVLKEV